MGCLLLITILAISGTLSRCAILKPSNVLSTYEIDVTTFSAVEKRDANEEDHLHVELEIDGAKVAKRFRELGHSDDVKLYRMGKYGRIHQHKGDGNEREWTVYGSTEGSVLAKQDPQHGLQLEGTLQHGGDEFYIQPQETSKRHLLHKVPPSYQMTLKPDTASKLPQRVKRSGTKYEVELYMVFDNSLYKRIKAVTRVNDTTIEFMKEYYGLLINEINYRYDCFRTQWDLDINIVMGGLMYFETDRDQPFNIELNSFGTWVNNNTVLRYVDDVQLHTASYFGPNGLAWINGVCTWFNYGLVQNDMDFGTIHISAHELGHNLGIFHDVDGDIRHDGHDHNVKQCRENYLMHPSGPGSAIGKTTPGNMWVFSECSYYDLKNYIGWLDGTGETLDFNNTRTWSDNCLTHKTANVSWLNGYGNRLPGAELTLDEQCHRMDPGAVFCPMMQLKYPQHKICLSIYCTKPNGNGCKPTFVYPGTPCGHLKVCMYGKCINHPSGKPQNASCPYAGKRDTFLINGVFSVCKDITRTTAHVCYSVFHKCCDICKAFETQSTQCKYGDRKPALCKDNRDCYKDYYREDCCATCESKRKLYLNYSDCEYGDKPLPYPIYIKNEPYYTCKEAVAISDIACYDNPYLCCGSCSGILNVNDCLYGDRSISITLRGLGDGFTCSDVSTYPDICYTQAKKCCNSCPIVRQKFTDAKCAYGDESGLTVSNVRGKMDTCTNVISRDTPGECYNSKSASRCCESCEKFRRTNTSDCAFGDKFGKQINVNGVHTTCKQGISSSNDSGLCYGYKETCCETCAKYVSNDAGCPYGDKLDQFWINDVLSVCKDITRATAHLCYSESDKCCETCKAFETQITQCKYGDKNPELCSRNYIDCYNDYYRGECCATCESRKKPYLNDSDCEYGDGLLKSPIYIGNAMYSTCKEAVAISHGSCYDNSKQCCESCAGLKLVDNVNCEYGDKLFVVDIDIDGESFSNCESAARKYPGMCYTDYNKKLCCATCKKIQFAVSDLCRNNHTSCDERAAKGDCVENHVQYMNKNCRKACGKCTNDTCKYGDHPGKQVWILDNTSSANYKHATCEQAITANTAKTECEDDRSHGTRERCCFSCATFA